MAINFKNHILLIISCSLFGISCTENDSFIYDDQADIVIQCSKSLSWNEGRAVTNDDGSGSFTDGDCVEMMISSAGTNSVLQSEYKEGQWIPSLKRSDFSSEKITVCAVYPVLSSVYNEEMLRSISLPSNQNSAQSLNSADILYANTSASLSDPCVMLRFGHALHRICINLKGDVPDDLQVELQSRTDGYISLENGAVSLSAEAASGWIQPYKKDKSSYMAIVLPQEAVAYHSGEGFIRLTSGGKSVTYALDPKINSFNPGMQTTVNLTLKSAETGDDMEFCSQIRWVYGVNSPDFPGKENIPTFNIWETNFEDGIWMRYGYDKMNPPMPQEVQFLTWKEGCGWYDCNKTFEYNGDGMMCWAASASNLLHWWMEHNKKFIEDYDSIYGPQYDYIQRPEKYTKMTAQNQQHSEIFNFFKRFFGNYGSWETGGVNWFVNGDSKNIYPVNRNFDGFFSNLFTKEDKVAVEIKSPSKENFNIWMKDAFRNNKAIGFSANDFAGTGTGVHAMTIWGAEFDEEGNVSYIYFTDNNNSEGEPNHASIKRFKIVYEKSSIPEIKDLMAYVRPLDYNDGTIPKAYPITSLTLVDLRQDIWQKLYLNNN